MFMLSFTHYVDGNVDAVRSRLTRKAHPASSASSTEVIPVSSNLSQVVVRTGWSADDETGRRNATLTATRFATEVFDAAVAA